MPVMTRSYKGWVLSHKRHLRADLRANPALRIKIGWTQKNYSRFKIGLKSLCNHKLSKVRVKMVSLENNSRDLSREALAELCGCDFGTGSEKLYYFIAHMCYSLMFITTRPRCMQSKSPVIPV